MDSLEQGAREVVKTLRSEGYTALWAGGCVRDRVMGRAPKDYDIASDAKPDEVEALFPHTVGVGAQFGVMLVVMPGERHYEVATFRAEGDYSDGRRPGQIRWANAYEDVVRRDFTINGLLFDPEAEELIDYVDGLHDLQAGVIRAIGDPHERFAEDKLRLLRAVRFAARFGFELDEATASAVAAHASEISVVSAERIAAEYDRILTDGGTVRGLTMLADLGLLAPSLPALAPPEVWKAARDRFEALSETSVDTPLGWATLLANLPPETVNTVTTGMRMSRQAQRAILAITELAGELQGYRALRTPARKRLLRHPQAAHALSLARASAEAGQFPTGDYEAARDDRQSWSPEDLHPPRWVNGATLKSLGGTPGPSFKKLLETVEDAQLDGSITDEQGALALAQRLLLETKAQPADE